MWLIGSGRQMAALAALAFTVAGAVSCTNNSGNTRDETATAPVGKCASRTHAAASDSGSSRCLSRRLKVRDITPHGMRG